MILCSYCINSMILFHAYSWEKYGFVTAPADLLHGNYFSSYSSWLQTLRSCYCCVHNYDREEDILLEQQLIRARICI